ncbi:MAG: putative Ig domain-containing protein [Halioglobus sp.]
MITWLANLSNKLLLIISMVLALAACGGGGGGGNGGGFLPDNGGEDGPPLTITTTTLPTAAAGADYTALVEADGGTEPYSWVVLDDAGTGFTINSEGFLTGIAPARGDYGLTLEVTDNNGDTEKFSTILIVEIGPDSLAITSTGLPNAIDGVQYTTLVEAAGGTEPYSWTVVDDGGTGFTINNEGFLTGTAPQSGDYGLTLQVTDSVEAVDRSSVILTVTGDTPQPLAIATSSLPGAEEGQGYNAILEAVGGQGEYQWTLINSGGSGLQLRPDGLLSGTAPDEGSYPITVSVMDDTRSVSSTLILTVAAESSPLTIITTSLPGGTVGSRYAAVLNASGGDEPYVWTLVSNGGQTSLALSAAGILTAVPTLPGDFGVIYRVSDGSSTDQVAAILTIASIGGGTDEPLKITTTALPEANRVLYAAALEAEGGVKPYTWGGGDTSTPGTGFTINPTSGSLTGNTNDLLPGQYGYTITVQDSAGAEDIRSYVITVPGGDTPPITILTENPLPTASVGLFYTTILRSVGGAGNSGPKWSVIDSAGFPGTVPSFATLADQDNGVLTWGSSDVAEGNYLITIQVTDGTDSSDVVTFDLQASAAPIRITSDTTLPGGVVGTAYSTVISAEGGGGTETWSVVSVTPAAGGLVFTGAGIANGTLTWAAPVVGNYTVTIKVVSEDGSGFASDDEKEFSLDILPTP